MTISGVSEHTERSVRSVADRGNEAYGRTLTLLTSMLVGMLIAVVAGQILMRRTVINPVRRVAQAAEHLAHGRFDVDLTAAAQDECGHMLRAMGLLRTQLFNDDRG